MSGNCGKHSHKTRGGAILKHVQNVFERSESHSNHTGINNPVKWLVEIFVAIQNEANKNEFAELLDEGDFKKSIAKLLYRVLLVNGNDVFKWKTYRQRDSRT